MDSNLKYLEFLKLGDEAGLRYFMTSLGGPLRFFAFNITKNKEVSEEIVSEAFYKLWQDREKILSQEHIKSYLYLVTRNASYDFVGSAYHTSMSLEHDSLPEMEGSSNLLNHIIYTELIEQIVSELCNLPAQQAEIFKMSYIQGMETQEICETLGTTTSNVYYAKSKALANLRLIFREKDISLYTILLTMLSIYLA